MKGTTRLFFTIIGINSPGNKYFDKNKAKLKKKY